MAAFTQPSEHKPRKGVVDNIIEQTLECDISLAAYNYSGASSSGNRLVFGRISKIPLEPAYPELNTDDGQHHLIFNTTTGLPDFKVSTLDLGALVRFFESDSFSGTLVDGEEFPSYSKGITAAMPGTHRNISAMLNAMVTSMTNQLRSESSSNYTAHGLTAKSVVVVRVQWGWMALPFTVITSSSILLLTVMFCSRRSQGVKLWKSNSTAVLYHEVSQTAETLSCRITDQQELKQEGKTTMVKLKDDRGTPGWSGSQINLLHVPRDASVASRQEGFSSSMESGRQ